MVYVSWTVTTAVVQSIMPLITGILETLLYQTKVYVYLVCWKVFRHSFIHKPCPKFHYILWKTFKVATLNNYCRTFRQISYTNSLPFHGRRGEGVEDIMWRCHFIIHTKFPLVVFFLSQFVWKALRKFFILQFCWIWILFFVVIVFALDEVSNYKTMCKPIPWS